MLIAAVLCAICAGAEFFLGYFLLALCRNERRSDRIVYLLGIESDRSCESDVQLPDRMLWRCHLGTAKAAGDDPKESSEVHCGATPWKGPAGRDSEMALSEAIGSIRSHRAVLRP